MRFRPLLVAVAAVLFLLGVAGGARALPPDGPSPDTPGTWASVSPARVAPGEALTFSLGGFPAGETVYIKLDDGSPDVCRVSAHGACVIHTQVIPSSGVVSGSLVLPHDLPAGAHWLRFLASAAVDPATPAAGTLGFTARGNSDFTVVAAGADTSASAPGRPAAPGAPGSAASGGATPTVSGGVAVAVRPEPVAEPAEVPAPPATSGAALAAAPEGGVTAIPAEGRVVLHLPDDYAAEWVFVYAFSEPTPFGWQRVAANGTVQVPTNDLPAGVHRFAALDAEGALIGWAAGEVAVDPAPAGAAENVQTAPAGSLPLAGLGVLGGCLLLSTGLVGWGLVPDARRGAVKRRHP
ncbi:hypothetical protein GCM10022198_16830 [Klugiella xanthotipulae]|uniref:Uncharacterized protein n=1 Tax=Klugiella xanthotipulae TaxID=244735 RepID=A0A543HHC7_9MICO|nr:hypothetical protein [Klugiella xanthotipulae]TQM57720.1 hypothetical protein FB466_2716 [Klugiella xanthotipulae]